MVEERHVLGLLVLGTLTWGFWSTCWHILSWPPLSCLHSHHPGWKILLRSWRQGSHVIKSGLGPVSPAFLDCVDHGWSLSPPRFRVRGQEPSFTSLFRWEGERDRGRASWAGPSQSRHEEHPFQISASWNPNVQPEWQRRETASALCFRVGQPRSTSLASQEEVRHLGRNSSCSHSPLTFVHPARP